MSKQAILEKINQRDWFYNFTLPSGETTTSYLPPEAQHVHDTRLAMMQKCLKSVYGDTAKGHSAIDLACHQGFFSHHLAALGHDSVLGIDARQQHVDDASLICEAMEQSQAQFSRRDVFSLSAETDGQFDTVLMFGLLYHLENPVGALRVAKALCKKVCLVETQVGPHVSGQLDWGHYEFVKPMMGSFAVIDESDETHGPEMSTLGICLAPSTQTLMWIMQRIGFSRVELLKPPEDSYEQIRHGKRVMVAGYME